LQERGFETLTSV
jgi:ATP-dependent RNA helicase DDX31/DBP7